MTVRELIDTLSDMDQDAIVEIASPEGSYELDWDYITDLLDDQTNQTYVQLGTVEN